MFEAVAMWMWKQWMSLTLKEGLAAGMSVRPHVVERETFRFMARLADAAEVARAQ